MSTEPPPPPPTPSHQLNFTPLHRTVQLENIHEQVTQNDLQQQQQQQIPSTRKVLTKYMTVIGDGSDIDTCEITTQ
jgi:phosphatidylethanolamine-binding protein (PEBP) family uncharacterized protein